jgi:hypothetical protein
MTNRRPGEPRSDRHLRPERRLLDAIGFRADLDCTEI